MAPQEKNIPDFRLDGYLPEGMYRASIAEVTFRFGSSNGRRRRLIMRVRRWVELARAIGAKRLFIDGSFITAKLDPNDVDAVVWLPTDFEEQLAHSELAAELEEMLLTRRPEEIFAAEDQIDWDEWTEFFSRTRDGDNRRKGLVEIEL